MIAETVDAWAQWLQGVGFVPTAMLTLTWKDEGPPNAGAALIWWGRLVAELSGSIFGNSYTKVVGHSYFSYVVGVELQQRGAIHLHCLVNEPIPFVIVHDWWGRHCGFAWVTSCTDPVKQVHYVLKYAIKGGVGADARLVFMRGLASHGHLVGLSEDRRLRALNLSKQWASCKRYHKLPAKV